MDRQRFIVFFTREYGYFLKPEHDLTLYVQPSFASPEIEARFDKFTSTENLERILGKKIFCDCIGRRTEHDGLVSFYITDAYLFAA